MAEKPTNMKNSVTAIEEIETRLEKLLKKRKQEIERDLEDRIRAEKEEADKKIEAIQKEINKGREILQDYRGVINEFETERSALQHELKEHFDKAIQYQTDIEKMAGLTLEELRKVSEVNKKLEALHHSAEEKVNTFKKDLEERFGIQAQLPESKEEAELKIDLEQELSKLKKIKELLETETTKAEETGVREAEVRAAEEKVKAEVKVEKVEKKEKEEKEEEKERKEEEKEEKNETGVPPDVPEINEVVESNLAAEEEAAPGEPQAEEQALGEEKEGFQKLFGALEKYRKIEPRNGNGEIGFFQNNGKVILDGEYMVATIDETLEEAKKLYLKLSHTESPKEQFFIKQEIINHQEILRKYILRNVKMCEREGASLPLYTAEILNLDVLKEILEKLSMENWSNPSDFGSFRNLIESLKDAYYARITPPVRYLRSLIDELGAEA
jgi:hypothetical protein